MFQRKLFESLAFRVLFSSFIFIIFPLVLYALFIYHGDYDEKLNDVFTEMHLYQQDQSNLVLELEKTNLNFLGAIHELIVLIQDQTGRASVDKIDRLLNTFSRGANWSAIFYLTVNKDFQLICTNSTLIQYENVNFTPYFSLDYLRTIHDNIFVGKDPVFGYSLYITFPVKDSNNKIVGVAGLSIDLNKLVSNLKTIRHIYNANISIIDEQGVVLSSSIYDFNRKRLVEVASFEEKTPPEVVPIKRIKSVTQGYEFYFNNQKRFLTSTPLPNTKTKIVLSVPSNRLLTKLYKSLSELSILLAFILFFGGIISYILTLRFAKPLSQLKSVMGKVGQGDLTVSFQHDPMGFEINYLGDQFNQMVVSLTSYIEEVKKEKAFKEAYQKELQIAKEIQQSILPEGLIQFHDIKTALYFQPAKEVAGDFYDWIIKEDNLFITIADGVGKGVSGCLYAFDLRSTLRTCETIFDDLSEIAIKTNEIFCEDTKETGSFVTAFLGQYHAPTKELSYINCGHNYPIIKRAAGNIERLETSGIAFGVELFDSVDVRKITLEPNDFIIFYTDGITDAQDTAHKLFSEKRLIAIIETCPYETPDELLALINQEIALFTKDADQYDDMTLLILKI